MNLRRILWELVFLLDHEEGRTFALPLLGLLLVVGALLFLAHQGAWLGRP